ncbi:MAG: sigma factor-like helix-turn-helix DNA-binding protein [Candidatus Hermodarchaeia archaeon]
MAKMIDPNKPLTQLELEIVYLRYYEGLHSSEIAEQLCIELETVKDMLKMVRERAVKALCTEFCVEIP